MRAVGRGSRRGLVDVGETCVEAMQIDRAEGAFTKFCERCVSSEIVRGRVKLRLLRSHGSDKEHRCEKVQPRWHEEAPEPREERVRGD